MELSLNFDFVARPPSLRFIVQSLFRIILVRKYRFT